MTTLRGPIALLGSGEFEPWTSSLDRRLLEAATTGDGTVAIVPTASALEGAVFDDWARKGLDHYAELGVPARVIDLRGRDDADRDDLVGALDGTSLVFFSGGNPAYLSRTLAGSRFWRAVVARLGDGAAFAGCSAGACLAGAFAPDSVTEFVLEEGWAPGLELLPDTWVLPHFDALDRHRPDLRSYFLSRVPDGGWALGIDERTAAVRIAGGWSVVGEGGVFLGRGSSARRFGPGETFTFDDLDLGAADRDLVLATEPLPAGAGPIALLSSDQFSDASAEVDRAVLERCGPRVGVVLDADPSNATALEHEAAAHYAGLGAEAIRLGPDDDVGGVDVLFLAGGDPKELVPALEGSRLWEDALRRWRQGLGLAGSSAGAMALCERCLFADAGRDLPLRWGLGLGPLRSFAVAVHAATRPDTWLQDVVASAVVDVLSIEDGTALLLEPGAAPAVIGAGRVDRHAPGLATWEPSTPRGAAPSPFPPGETVRLYHRTAAAADILRLGFLDSLENGRRDGAWEGTWFADEPLSPAEGPDGDTFLVLEVPRRVAERFEWTDPSKPYREFVLPRGVANRFGPPKLLAPDGTVRDPEPEQLLLAEVSWGSAPRPRDR